MSRLNSSLAIVEKGFRGALEEQYGNIVWLSECMKSMRANHNLLLTGSAVAMCFEQQAAMSLDIGEVEKVMLSHNPYSIKALIEKGARIWVLSEDLAKYSSDLKLIDGVEVTETMAQLCLEHDKVWFW
ncbi:hypothetical protein [Pseudoalteromonas sp. OOF1S-7]|uniref:hypothetical protein n=1 Tax=Pseudoalteromonas sp. OOF1S-7 TaxID=2917757 RepID=UPI001EF4C4F6|nr:hypothetical protein [Pseudoalteromonas sp. OOF1S-7]MCG7536681.1 hypothetical protein [Pseudoalteromonas sp. OOF1S-7]